MNKQQTTIEVDALIQQMKANKQQEHPTAPTVENKEDSSSEEWIYDVNEKEGEIHILEPGATVVLATIYALPLEKEEYDLAKLICSAPRLKQENKKLLEDNKLLREALQWMITMYQLSSDYKNLSPSWQQKTNEAIAVLEQTK